MADKAKCGALNRKGQPCQRAPAPGKKRCTLHGGKSTGPKDRKKMAQAMTGNKNAVKTGLYERLWPLTDEEQDIYDGLHLDTAAVIEDALKMLILRERRIMRRIQALEAVDLAVVEVVEMEKGDITKKASNVERIANLENGLSIIADRKQKLLDLKAKLESGEGTDDSTLDSLVEALRMSRERRDDDEVTPDGQT